MPFTRSELDVALVPKILGDWTWSSQITPDILNYVHKRTPFGAYRIELMVDDAFRYGMNVKEGGDIPDDFMTSFIRAVKLSELYGYSVWNHGKTGQLGQVLGTLHSNSRGGVQGFEEDDEGEPINVNYQKTVHGGTPEQIPIRQVTILHPELTSNDYIGSPVLEPVIDDIISLQLWRAAASIRANEYGNAGKIAWKPEAWAPAEKAMMAKVFPRAKVITVSGTDFKMENLGGLLSDTELVTVLGSHMSGMAAGFGTSKSDIEGSSAGQKLGDDFNQSGYFMTLENIQRSYAPFAYSILDRMGYAGALDEEFPFKPPREIPVDQRIQSLINIGLAYTTLINTETADTAVVNVMKKLFLQQAVMF
jgi:hypothetical protein